MEKKFFLYIAAVVLSITALTGCVSAPEGNAGQGAVQQGLKEDAGPVDVVMRWLKALKAEDAVAYIDTYWPGAEKIIEFRGERTELLGREEILRHQKIWWDRHDTGSVTYEKPTVEEHEHPDRKVVVLTHTSHRFSDRFLFLQRDGVWKIEHHSVHEIGAPKVVSDFQRWADVNDSGELEDEEYKRFVRAGTILVIGPHKNRSPLDGVFDFNGDGEIDEKEVRLARIYFFTTGLRGVLKTLGAEERRRRFDIDGNGVFDDRDGEILQRYLSSFNYLKLREREVKSRFEKRIDRNGDGILSKDEQVEAFHILFESILLLPHDPEKIRAAALERLENMEEGQAVLQGTVTEQKAVSSEVEGRRVAVVSLETMTGAVVDETVDGLLLFIENALVNSGRVKVVERNNIESIVEEYEFQRTAMTDESTAVEIGKLANAELIVTGAVTLVGDSYYLNIKLIDVESGEIAGSSLAGADEEDGFLEMCNTAVEALFSR